jgi:hypothetical protein
MERPTWAGVRAIFLAVTALFLLPLQAQAERNWEFSVVRVRRESLLLEPRHEDQFWGQR